MTALVFITGASSGIGLAIAQQFHPGTGKQAVERRGIPGQRAQRHRHR